MNALFVALALTTVSCPPPDLKPGDVVRVVLKDDRSFNVVVSVVRSTGITGDVVVGSLRTPMTFSCADVYEILPSTIPTAPQRLGRTRSREKASPAFTRYIAVPVFGPIGITPDTLDPKSVTAPGIEEVLRLARRQSINHIVFFIDSPGGLVAEAQAISRLIRAADDEFTTVAVVNRSISAANMIAFSCDTIMITGDASLGGAATYLQPQGNAPEYDAKINSIVAADLRSVAIAEGHRGEIADAISRPEAVVYLDLTTSPAQIEIDPPTMRRENLMLLAPEGQVATFDARQLAALGFMTFANETDLALAFEDDAGNRPSDLRQHGDYGQRLIERHVESIITRFNAARSVASRSIALTNSADRSIESVRSRQAAARSYSPTNATYFYDERTGLLTDESLRLWQSRHDHAISLWMSVQSAATELAFVQREVRALVRDLDTNIYWSLDPAIEALIDDIFASIEKTLPFIREAEDAYSLADQTIRQLQSARSRLGP